MNLVQSIVDGVEKLVAGVSLLRMPAVIEVKYPSGHPAKGEDAGRFLLERGEDGISYKWQQAPYSLMRHPAIADVVTRHEFTNLDSLVAYLATWHAPPSRDASKAVFVHGSRFASQRVTALLDEPHPEVGSVSLEVHRHPAWVRWSKAAGNGEAKDLDHVALADLLLDNAEDLVEPMLAQALAKFRAAQEIEHTSDQDSAGSMGVKLTWKTGVGTGSDSKSSDARVPREFVANIPAFVGAWAPGKEPRHEARFRLRVVPPKNKDAMPLFRIIWLNAPDYDQAAREALHEQVEGVFEGAAPVYSGSPVVERFVALK